jgi:hypothetical protein
VAVQVVIVADVRINLTNNKMKISDTINEIVNKPEQYQIGIDTFERMESNCTLEERLAFVRGNLDKYCWRKKGQDKQDFEKIINYAQWAIRQLEKL